MVRFTVAFGGSVAGRWLPGAHGGLSNERRLDPERFPQAIHVDGRDGGAVGGHRAQPRAGAGRAQQQAEPRRDRHRRHGRLEPQGLRRREHRRPVRRGPCLRREDHRALPERQGLSRLQGDAREGEGHRRRDHRDAGPHARRDHDGRAAGRQARVLPEAADPHRARGAHDHRGGPPIQGRHADGQPGPVLPVDAAAEGMARRRGDRQRDRGPRLDGPAGRRRSVVRLRGPGQAEGHAAGAEGRSTGSGGSGRWRSGRTIPPITR